MKIIDQEYSSDGAVKFLWELAPDISVESVYFKFNGGHNICISSQAGCNVGCIFCETGKQKNLKNLSPVEIYEQVRLTAERLNIKKFQTVLFAGMGEPLNNFHSVSKSTEMFLDNDITEEVSLTTSGIIPYIKKLSSVPVRRLGISLHATTNELRNRLIPINKKYPIENLVAAGEQYFNETNNPVTINYLLFDKLNDTDEDIERLIKLLSPFVFKIKLKVWNNIAAEGLTKSPDARFSDFSTELTSNGFSVTSCLSEGVSIRAGCGQLRSAKRVLRLNSAVAS